MRCEFFDSLKRGLGAALLLGVALLALGTPPASAIDLNPATPATQDFTIGTSATATLPTDWKADKQTVQRTLGTYAAAVSATERSAGNNMSSTAGNGIYNYAAGDPATSTERAVGFISSSTATKSGNLYAMYTNKLGSSMTSLTISYAVEKYRMGTNAAGFSVQMYYSTDGATWTSAGADFLTSFAGGDASNSGYADAPGATVSVTDKVLTPAAPIPDDSVIYLAWNYSVTTGTTTSNAQALGIDDVSVTGTGSGGGTPELNVSDASTTEGDSGTKILAFTVSLTSPAPAGGVTFDVETSDNGSAVAGEDYVANSVTGASIAEGNSTYTFNVTINGDLDFEPDETFTVTVSNVVGDVDEGDLEGSGTITNDDVTEVSIHDIQGAGNFSPYNNQILQTTGIVTGLQALGSVRGFFLQNAEGDYDGDEGTSEGIFVYVGGSTSTLPADAQIGNEIAIRGLVTEYKPTFPANPDEPTFTELKNSTIMAVYETDVDLPPAIEITSDMTPTDGDQEQLEHLEGMRVYVGDLDVIAPSGGTRAEADGTSVSNGTFFGVISGLDRPFREPGVRALDALPSGAPAECVPPDTTGCLLRFDGNPERLRVASGLLVDNLGTPSDLLDVGVGQTVSEIEGPLYYDSRNYTVMTDPLAPTPSIAGDLEATAVPSPASDEFTVASLNLDRFYNTADDGHGDQEVVMTTDGYDLRMAKASLAIRDVLLNPDVIAVQEVETLAVLQALATLINTDNGGTTSYVAYLEDGNDTVAYLNTGLLVNTNRVTVSAVTQEGADALFDDPNDETWDEVFAWPPLMLTAAVSGNSVTIIANQFEPLTSVGLDTPNGRWARARRAAQAEWLADFVHDRQVADPQERIILAGDFNAYQFNDGLVDVIGTVKGTPAAATEVVVASADLVDPDLVDLVDLVSGEDQHSYVGANDGHAAVLDHILANDKAYSTFRGMAFGRFNEGFYDVLRNDDTRPERLGIHDAPVARFLVTSATVVTPDGGESYYNTGDVVDVSFTHNLGDTGHVDISLSRDGGTNWETLKSNFGADNLGVGDSFTATDGLFVWHAAGAATTDAIVRVAPSGYPGAGDTSDGSFTIAMGLFVGSSTINFGNQAIGTTSTTRYLGLQNLTTAALPLSALGLSGPHAADFAAAGGTCGGSLAPGGSCKFELTFTPSASGARTATATFTGGLATFNVALQGYGAQPLLVSSSSVNLLAEPLGTTGAPRTVNLYNLSASALALTFGIGGANAGDFALVSNTCGANLGAGASCSFGVTMTPTAVGARSGVVNITADGTPYTVNLSGYGYLPLFLSMSKLQWGNQVVTTTSGAKTVTLTNLSTAELTLSGFSITGTNAGDFATSGTTCGGTLLGKASCTVDVTFTPSGLGARSGVLNVTADLTPYTVALSGYGAAEVFVSSSLVRFPPQTVGNTSAPFAVNVYNQSTGSLTMSIPFTLGGANPGDFAIVSNTCDTELEAGTSCTFEVTSSPTALGYRYATVSFTAGGPTYTVNLAGTGY